MNDKLETYITWLMSILLTLVCIFLFGLMGIGARAAYLAWTHTTCTTQEATR